MRNPTTSDRPWVARPATEHDLKCWPDFYADVFHGRKRAELRRADRDYRVGDYLRLREFDPAESRYTGRWSMHMITHVVRDAPEFGLAEGYAMLSITEGLAQGMEQP